MQCLQEHCLPGDVSFLLFFGLSLYLSYNPLQLKLNMLGIIGITFALKTAACDISVELPYLLHFHARDMFLP